MQLPKSVWESRCNTQMEEMIELDRAKKWEKGAEEMEDMEEGG